MGADRPSSQSINFMSSSRGQTSAGFETLADRKAVLLGPRVTGSPFQNDADWWLITLSDLTLLLFGFLVFWYATTKMSAQTPEVSRVAAVDSSKPVSAAMSATTPLAAEAWQAVHGDLVRFIASMGLTKEVTIESTPSEIVLSLRDTVPFASGKAELRARALPVLEKIVATVLAHPHLSVAISGHTDSLRIASAEFPSNWELSTARASKVARYLVVKGIHPSRISVQGFADHRPRKPNSTALNRRANRRVEIRLFHENNSVREKTAQG